MIIMLDPLLLAPPLVVLAELQVTIAPTLSRVPCLPALQPLLAAHLALEAVP